VAKPPADHAVSAYPDGFADAILVVSFGGPEGPDDVMPFLENVTRARNVPPERLEEVARHYLRFGGVSPINAQNRALIAALEEELRAHGIELPVYFGNRNWHPLLADTVAQMTGDGVRRALVFLTSAFSSYSGCRQYRENLYVAQEAAGPDAPELPRLRLPFNHPGFIAANADRLRAALAESGPDAHVAFTAHSIPVAMAERCAYEAQLAESARLVATEAGAVDHALVYQSRSGPPHVPWLGPDILDHLRDVYGRGGTDVVVSPLGFLSDHLEVLYDLDVEAAGLAQDLGLHLVRAGTPGTHPAFVSAIRKLIQERLGGSKARPALGRLPANPDACALTCCLPGTSRPSPWEAVAA
jgi:protoporphyrin/coproporphyrin ferrochelatase